MNQPLNNQPPNNQSPNVTSISASPISSNTIFTNNTNGINKNKINTVDVNPWYSIDAVKHNNYYMFQDGIDKVKIDCHGIFSNINNDNNALIMLETIKNLLIKNNFFTEDQFKNEYADIQQYLTDLTNAKKVADKLAEQNNISSKEEAHNRFLDSLNRTTKTTWYK